MKQLSPIFFIICLIINIIAGLILTCYPIFNMVLNSVVLCVAALFALWLNKKPVLLAFSTSLTFIIPPVTLIEFIIGLLSPAHMADNWGIIANLCLMALEGFIIYTVIKRSEKSLSN